MKKLIVIFFLILFSCSGYRYRNAHGLLGKLPNVENAKESSTIFIIRKKSFAGCGVSYKFALDKRLVIALNSGEYTKFDINAGKHIFGTISHTTLGVRKECHINIDCKPNRKYYLLIFPSFGGPPVQIKAIDSEEAKKHIAKSYRIILDYDEKFRKTFADDKDLDGIVDLDDFCPAQMENFNRVNDDDGCPE